MPRFLFSASMSLDGYIAGPGGDMSWLADHIEPDPEVDALWPRIGAVLSGRVTVTGDDPNAGTDAEGAFGGLWHGPMVVLSRTLDPGPRAVDVTVIHDPAEAIAAAREAAGDADYVGVFGARTAATCVELGALDEVMTNVVPVLLGGGTRLFAHDGPRVPLELTRVTRVGRSVNLWYGVTR